MKSPTPIVKTDVKAAQKLTEKQKLLALNRELLQLAKQLGVTLPR